ncbi:MAG: amidohydrolase family protein [Leptospiraceae bacterium]|nr:amidohydrolase family protein [Leptospiraceae bacterium]MCP5495249.1 amidohydrolase family protein [Leptospiraceae bacterium]
MLEYISGRIVTHDSDFIGSICINKETGLIHSIQKDNLVSEHSRTLVIFPGFGDIHIHAREDNTGKHNYKEDYVSVSQASINGGVTHIADMPNNPSPPIDDTSYLLKSELKQKASIHVTLYAGIGPGTVPLTTKVPYKVYMGPSIGELYFRSNEELEKTVREYIGENVSFHCEDPDILEKSKNETYHEDRRPSKAETLATDFAIYLIEKYNLQGKLCHYSTKEGLRKIIEAKKRGVNVTCEVTPTHLFFDRSMITDENRRWLQMNPPIREKEDKEYLIQAIKDGYIDYLATDHAPHTQEEKEKGISGVSHLDTYSNFVTYLIKTCNVSLQKIAKICSKNPGDFVNPYLPKEFGKGFGCIQPGYSANFTILNLNRPITITKEMIRSKSGWSPFEGFTFPGSVETVYYRGKRLK